MVTTDTSANVRVWDIPSSRCIDFFKMPSPVLSISFTPRSDFIATSHSDSNGIYLWANTGYFSELYLKPIPKEPKVITLPSLADFVDIESDEDSMEDEGLYMY